MGKVVKGLASTLTGGLLGGPKESKAAESKQRQEEDERAAAVAEARKARLAAASKKGRKDLRISLGGQTSGGVNIE